MSICKVNEDSGGAEFCSHMLDYIVAIESLYLYPVNLTPLISRSASLTINLSLPRRGGYRGIGLNRNYTKFDTSDF